MAPGYDAASSGQRAARPVRSVAEGTTLSSAYGDDQVAHVFDILAPAAELAAWSAIPGAYPTRTPSTEGLDRIVAQTRDGRQLRVFVKTLHSLRHWPMIDLIPPALRDDAVARFPWRAEADIYASPMLASLPPGLRGPRIYEVEELGDERVRIWMEDVPAAERPWDAARYATAARSLGRMAARSLGAQIPAGSPRLLPGYQFIYAGRTVVSDLPMVRSEELWRHPGLAAALGADPDLRHDLLALADRAAAILGALDRLPRSLAHGDACPQNLLADPGSDGCFVAVDWGFAGPAPIGYDLGQLLVGRAESGELPADDLRATFDVILSAYLDGLRDAQVTLSEEQVRRGFVGGMLLRSAFTALPFEWLRGALDDATASAIAHRARYARYLLDLGRSF